MSEVRARFPEWCHVCNDLIAINEPIAKVRGRWVHPRRAPGGDDE